MNTVETDISLLFRVHLWVLFFHDYSDGSN